MAAPGIPTDRSARTCKTIESVVGGRPAAAADCQRARPQSAAASNTGAVTATNGIGSGNTAAAAGHCVGPQVNVARATNHTRIRR